MRYSNFQRLGLVFHFFLVDFSYSIFVHEKPAVFYADNSLHQTVAFPLNKNRERQAFQTEILQFLGLNKAPQRRETNEAAAPSYMFDLYKTMLSEDREPDEDDQTEMNPLFSYLNVNDRRPMVADLFDANQADTIMSFVNQAHISHRNTRRDHFEHLHFDLNDIKSDYRLIGAELRVYQNRSSVRTPTTLQVFAVRSAGNGRDENFHLITSSKLDRAGETWLVLNVTTALEFWRNNPRENFGLLMEVLDERGERHNPSAFGLSSSFMVGFFNADNHQAHRRARRSTRPEVTVRDDYNDWQSITGTNPKWARTVCQKRTLYVSFRDLGWRDWIIAPDGYAAYYCYGECTFPLTNSLNATNHAIVQTLAHLMNPEVVPKPCCAPTKLSPISVLYFDDSSNVVLKKYNHMIVKSCGCH